MELANDEGGAPRSLAEVIAEGPDSDIQNLRDVMGGLEVMNNEGEGPHSPAKIIAEGHRAP